jgi:hypothetical protein
MRDTVEEKVQQNAERVEALRVAAQKAEAERQELGAKLECARARFVELQKLVDLEQAEQPRGPPARPVDPVESAVALAVSTVSQKSPLVMRYLPQLLQALRTIQIPDDEMRAAAADAIDAASEDNDLDDDASDVDFFADGIAAQAPQLEAPARGSGGGGDAAPAGEPPASSGEERKRGQRSRSPKNGADL